MDQEITISAEKYIELKVKEEKLNVILNLIFDNCRKYSYDNQLTLNEDRDLMTYLRITEREKYYGILNEFIEAENLNKKEEE